MASKPETKLRLKIQKAVRQEYGQLVFIEHPTAGMYGSGLLDLVGCLGGRFFALEVKYGKGKPTERQQEMIHRIGEAGGVAAVVRSVEEALSVLEE